jgi:hypothetical protein
LPKNPLKRSKKNEKLRRGTNNNFSKMKSRIAMRLKGQTVTEIINLALKVHDQMTAAGGTFATPAVPFAQLLTQITTLQAGQQKAIDGSRADTIARDQALEIVIDSLKKMAHYVQIESDGDPAIINQAGFELAKSSRQVYDATETPMLKSAAGTPLAGELKLRWKKVVNARMYEVQISQTLPTSEDSWNHYSFPAFTSVVIKGQPSGKLIWMRVRALSAAGTSDWSSVMDKRVP